MITGHLLDSDKIMLETYSLDTNLCLDLGTHQGLSASVLSKNSKRVVTIDLFEDFQKIENTDNREHYTSLYNKNPYTYKGVKKDLATFRNIEVYKDFTYTDKIDLRSIDLIFIDGDHSFEGITKDFNRWEPFLVVGGHILIHDSYAGWVGVNLFIFEQIGKNESFARVDYRGSTSVWKKLSGVKK